MLVSLLLASVVGFAFYHAGFSEANIITVYILGVLMTAVWTNGPFYGAVDSLLSVAAFNYFFTVPRFTFQANDPSYPVTFLIMLCSSIIAGLSGQPVKAQARLAAQKSYYTGAFAGEQPETPEGTHGMGLPAPSGGAAEPDVCAPHSLCAQ